MKTFRRGYGPGGVDKSRVAAVRLLDAALGTGKRPAESAGAMRSLTSEERARALRLVATVFRYLGRADAVIDALVRKRPERKPEILLRLAVVEMHACETPSHAAVDQAVRQMRMDRKTRHLASFANAVLRRAADPGMREVWKSAGPSELPDWLAVPLREEYGDGTLRRIRRVHERDPPLDITPRKSPDTPRLAELLGASTLPTGTLRIHESVQVSALPEFYDGSWWVQDAAAALPVQLLGDLKGMSVLDLFAAPGGKTMQCAAAGAKVTAIDRSEARMKVLARNLRRTRLDAGLIKADAYRWDPENRFDVVIVDAPCTATGTIRRNPDVPHLKAPSRQDIDRVVESQKGILERAATFLRPKGRLLYCVCSLLPREGEEVAKFAKAKLSLESEPIPVNKPFDEKWHSPAGGLRLRPDFWEDMGGMDGFYCVVLSRS